MNRLVALKMLRAADLARPEERARFRREVEAVGRLRHPNIVQIYEVGSLETQPYFSMEFMGGGSLAQQLQGKPQPPREAAALVATLAGAVHVAHQHGIIHRDLKPANILLAEDRGQKTEDSKVRNVGASSALSSVLCPLSSTPKIADFGLAKWLGADQVLSRSGDVMGTPAYMAPEQATGQNQEIGPATDVYALGAILYELLTGRPPFLGETTLDTLEQVRSREPVRPRRLRPGLPRDLEIICLKCLEKEARQRYGSAEALAEDLHRYLAGRPIRARAVHAGERAVKWARRRPALAALIAVTLLAALGFTAGTVVYTAQLHRHAVELQQALGEVRDRERGVRQFLYASDIIAAFRFWERGDRQAIEELLQRHHPASPAAEDERGFEWRYLQRVSRDGDRVTLRGHVGEVLRVAFSPDGKLLASCGEDGAVKLWDTATWRVRATWRSHAGKVTSIAFSPDGTNLALAGHGLKLALWNLDGRSEGAGSLVPQPDVVGTPVAYQGQWLASGSFDGLVRLWKLPSRKEKLQFPCHHDRVSDLAFSPDGKWLAASYADLPSSNRVDLWEVPSGKMRQLLHRGPVRHVEFSHDGQCLGTTDQDTLRLWDPRTGRQVTTLQAPFQLAAFAFSPDDRYVALVPSESETLVQLWERLDNTWALRGFSRGSHAAKHGAVAFSPDGRTIAVATQEGTIEVWYRDMPSDREYLRTDSQAGGTVVYSPDGQTLAVPYTGRTVKLLDTATCQVKAILDGYNSDVQGLAFSPDGKILATAGAHDETIHLWDMAGRKELGRLTGVRGPVFALAFSPDGKRLASGGGKLQVWDLTTRTALPPPSGFTGSIRQLAFSPDGMTLAAGADDPMVRFWDPATGKETGQLKLTAGFAALAYAPDGRTLATATNQGVITLWETASMRALGSVRKHLHHMDTHGVAFLAFAPDGKTLASADYGRRVNLWQCQGRMLTEPSRATIRFPMPVQGVAFSPDGKTLATSSLDGQVRLWDHSTFAFRKPPSQGISPVHGLAFAADGRTVLTGSTVPTIWVRTLFMGVTLKDRWAMDQTEDSIRFWDITSKEQCGTLPAEHVAGVQSTALAMSPDGGMLATGNSGGMVWLWDTADRQKRCLLLAADMVRKAKPGVDKVGQLNWFTYPDQHIRIKAIAFSRDGRKLAVTCEDGGLTLWGTADGHLERVLAQGLEDVSGVAFSPRGDLLASNHGSEIRLWNPETGQVRTLGKHKDVVSCVAFSPDGRWLISGAKDGGIKVWDMTTEREKVLLESHRDEITGLAFSPDGKTLASASTDGTVKLWHVATAQEFVTLDPQIGKVRCVAFSPDGLTLAAGGEYSNGNGQVCFWHAAPLR